MTRALRIKLDAVPEQVEKSAGLIEGLAISLVSLGPGGSKAEYQAPKPAKLEFRLGLREQVRGAPAPERRLLATLSGELSLEGPSARPVFVVAPAAAATALSLEVAPAELAKTPPPVETGPFAAITARRPRHRALPLSFDPVSFRGTEALSPRRLVILAELLAGFRFFDVEARLELAGAGEAEFELNDTLEGRITPDSPPPLPSYDVLLIDDVGKPLDGVPLRISRPRNEEVVTTDADGFVRFVTDEAEQGRVALADVSALKQRLGPLWDQTDRGKAASPPLTEETTILALRGTESPEVGLDTRGSAVLRVQQYVFLARLEGMFFDLNKTFLLPSALGGLREARALYERHNPGSLLIVGHTDRSGSTSVNDPLSLERARSVAAFLSDDAATWEENYGSSVPEAKRWGRHEDEQMAGALPDFPETRAPGETPIPWFQRTRGLRAGAELDAGGRTRLIEEYMAQDGVDVNELGLQIELVRHGAGEHFPLDPSGSELDADAPDDERDQLDRRVELFFFDHELGVQPKVADGSNSSASSQEYPEWRRRALELSEISAHGGLRDRHVSVVLLSNSGNQPLAERSVELLVEGEPPITRQTDADGVFEQAGLPPGDHVLRVDGIESFVSATPVDVVRRPHVVIGHVLEPSEAEAS